MKLTALDPSKFTIPTAIAAPRVAPRAEGQPVVRRSVIMPMLQANCASCHNPGQVGAAHWTLDTAADAAEDLRRHRIGGRQRATCRRGRRRRTASRCSNSKRLDQATIDAIVKWSRAGGPLDVPASTRRSCRRAARRSRRRARTSCCRCREAYAGSLSVPERLPLLRPRPAHHQADVHHRLRGDSRPSRRDPPRADLPHRHVAGRRGGQDLRAATASPGGVATGRSSLPSTTAPRSGTHDVPGFTGQAGLIAGWVPGQDPVIYPEHSGILMQPGDALVLQVHYHYDTTPVPDRTTVAIQTDPGTAQLQEDRHHQPDRAGRDPVHARRRPRRCATATRRSPTTRGSTVRIGSAAEAGLLGTVRQDARASSPPTSRTASRRRPATTRCPSRERSSRCSGTSTRSARRSGSRSIPTRRNRRCCSTSRRGTSTGR